MDIDEVVVVAGHTERQRGQYLWLGRKGVCVGLVNGPATIEDLAAILRVGGRR